MQESECVTLNVAGRQLLARLSLASGHCEAEVMRLALGAFKVGLATTLRGGKVMLREADGSSSDLVGFTNGDGP